MADLVIVGAGPQALTLSCLMLQKRSRLKRRLRIVDPSGRWLSRWQRQMERYEIPWLRSPSPHHPHPNAHALRRFAHRQQRNRELEGAYGLPHTDLFAAFCREVIAEFELEECVQAASVERLRLPGSGRGPLELGLSDGRIWHAERVVIATGNGTPQWPAWITTISGDHPAEALRHSDAIDLPALQLRPGERILIVGGGLTSAHLSLGALRRGAQVLLLCRRRLKHKPFDADPGWLGPKYLKAFQAEPCMHRRRHLVLEARNGGSITPEAAAELRQAERRGELQLHEHCQVQTARWSADQWDIVCSEGQQLVADRIWLATGHRQGVSQQPLLRQLHQQRPIELVDDWPVLGPDLSWPGTLVHVMGGLCALQIGPAARNLFGGREAAQRICRAVVKH
jgi:cation diffusion facilitator CzcD-associated flavoprotein CzcO